MDKYYCLVCDTEGTWEENPCACGKIAVCKDCCKKCKGGINCFLCSRCPDKNKCPGVVCEKVRG